jgi:hypothetical protein
LFSGLNRISEISGNAVFPDKETGKRISVFLIRKSRFSSEKVYYQKIAMVCFDFVHRGIFTLLSDAESSDFVFGADCQNESAAAGIQEF